MRFSSGRNRSASGHTGRNVSLYAGDRTRLAEGTGSQPQLQETAVPSLFDPVQLGALALPNGIAMAPLTRNRAIAGLNPGYLTVESYRQRASAGLTIAEATRNSPLGQGYLDTPGIHSPDQVAAWNDVTDAAHGDVGRVFLKLWHVGRISHTPLLPDGAAPVSSANRRANAQTFSAEGFFDVSQPRALRDDEIPGLIADYRNAARNAIDAGFDGVEVHSDDRSSATRTWCTGCESTRSSTLCRRTSFTVAERDSPTTGR